MDYKFDLVEGVATIQQDSLQVRPFSGVVSATCENGYNNSGAVDSFVLSVPSHNYSHRFYLLGNKFFVNTVEKTNLAIDDLKVIILKQVFPKAVGGTALTTLDELADGSDRFALTAAQKTFINGLMAVNNPSGT